MWTLILFIYAGPMAKGDNVALISVPKFINEQACKTAGEQAKQLTNGTLKSTSFICVRNSNS